MVGLAAALCAGLSIGREGPYVHVAAIVVVLLLRFKPFRFLKVFSLAAGFPCTVVCAAKGEPSLPRFKAVDIYVHTCHVSITHPTCTDAHAPGARKTTRW